MSDTCPTVKIIRDGQIVVINLSDFNPEEHEVADASELESVKPLDPASTVTDAETVPPTGFTVGKNGKRGGASKFVILDASKKPINEEEFDTIDDAKAMIELITGQKAE